MVKRIFLFFLFFTLHYTLAQVELNELEQETEAIAEQLGDDADLIQLAENLDYYRENKINLNTATKEVLAQLGFLNAFQIYNLLEHRRKYGRIVTFYELEYLNGFDASVLQKLELFTYLGSTESRKHSLKDYLTKGRHLTFVRAQWGLEERKGFELRRRLLAGDSTVTNYYVGDPYRTFIRHRYVYANQFSIGLTGEKDAGEPFVWEPGQRGFDFYSGHIALMRQKRLKTFIFGDYQIQFGQGLVLWSSLAFRKSPAVLNIQRFGRGFIPYNGLDENRFFRGAAATYSFGKVDLSVFYSNKRMSSALSTIEDEESGETYDEAGSIRLSGLHRTPTERAARNTLSLESYGAHLTTDFSSVRLGGTVVEHRFNPPLASSTQLYQKYNLRGSSVRNASIDYQILLPSVHLFGEVATNSFGGIAMTHGAYLSAGSKFTYALLYRHFQKEYAALFNASFAEGTGKDAERGFYTGFRWEAAPRLFVNAYADLYQFDWPRYDVNQPSRGRDVFVQSEYIASRRYNFYIRVRSENRLVNGPDEFVVRPTADERRSGFRFHQNILPSRNFSLASRIEYSYFESYSGVSTGWLLFQDFRYLPSNFPIKWTYRLAVYDTDDYNSRIYAFENDVLYSFSIPALYDRGIRSYLLVEYTYGRATFWLRYAVTRFSDKYVISSGLQEINGNRSSEIKLQCRIKL
ncbi:MAG: helix-hairpin-helix domain-containing protein [Thermaurantimonas sp.]|uniref:helix-hairpin-helix domain-containing protein n=1 Tax=Thermaurantimonas sp. TaxID=2681568 RepID=UPI00391D7DC9